MTTESLDMPDQPAIIKRISKEARDAVNKKPPKPDRTFGKSLSYQQQLFVDEYVIDGNGSRAALAAGYSKNNTKEQASRLLTKANIKAAIEHKYAAKADKSESTRQFVLRTLQEEAQGKADSTATSRIQAATALGKTEAMFTDKVIGDQDLTVTVVNSYGDGKPTGDTDNEG